MTPKAFIPAALDDAGLSPDAFRIWCHIQRRGTLFGSVVGIAARCGIGRTKTREALRWLVANKWATAFERTGQTTEYIALHPYLHADGTPTKTGRGKKATPTGIERGTPTRSGRPPLPDPVAKGNPTKGIQSKVYTNKFRKL
jgi:hypothetical protein